MRCAACDVELLQETFPMKCADGCTRSFCRVCVRKLDAAPAGMAHLVRADMPAETRMRSIPSSGAGAIVHNVSWGNPDL